MTNRELIAILTQYPPDMRVLVDGYEGDMDDPHVYPDVAGIGAGFGGHSGDHSALDGPPTEWDSPAPTAEAVVRISRTASRDKCWSADQAATVAALWRAHKETP